MSEQLYFPEPVQIPRELRKKTIQERFEQFHELNPNIYERLVALARGLKARGRNRMAIGMLWEVLRWQYFQVTVDPTSEFRLNDHYRSRYARLIEAQEPDLLGVFQMRDIKTP